MGWMPEEMCFYSRRWKDIPIFFDTSKPAMGPPSFISSGKQGFCHLRSRDGGLEAYHCPPSSNEIKNALNYTCAHRVHMTYTGKTCLFNDYCLPDCEAVYSSRKVPTFWRNQLPPFSLFHPEDRNSIFPRNVGIFLPEYTASYIKSSSHESLESQIHTLVFIIM